MYTARGTNSSSELQEQSHHSKLRTREYLEGNRRKVTNRKVSKDKDPSLPHQTEPSQSARTGTPEITAGFSMPAIQ